MSPKRGVGLDTVWPTSTEGEGLTSGMLRLHPVCVSDVTKSDTAGELAGTARSL